MDRADRLALELKRARELQSVFLPRTLPPVPGIRTAVLCEPAFELTGDFYDCVPLRMLEVGLFMADVRGKGIAGAMVQAMVRALFHVEAPKHESPTPVLRSLNRLMHTDLEPEGFVTALYAILSLERRELRVVRGGHEPLLIAHPQGGVQRLEPDGMGLGMDGGDVFDQVLAEQVAPIEPGTLLALYTDGLVDTLSPDGEPFGPERLERLIDRPGATVEQIREAVAEALTGHRGDRDWVDDVTLLLVRVVETA